MKYKYCKICNKKFKYNSNSQKYCSDICKRKGYKIKEKRYYQKNKIKIRKRQRQYQKQNKKLFYNLNKKWIKKHLWYRTYANAMMRCNNVNTDSYKYYGKKGIKFNLKVKDVKYLWFRDKAYLMKKPSIDRIDNKGNYELSNCRYIEFVDNLKRRYTKKDKTLDKA